jgi:hypothetical protein
MTTVYPWTRLEGHKDSLTRQLGSEANFFHTVASPEGQISPFTIGCGVKFNYKGDPHIDVAKLLLKAWYDTIYKNPHLMAEIKDGKAVVNINPRDLELKAEANFSIESVKTPDEIFQAIVKRPFPRLYYFPGTSELLLEVGHWHIDGRGIFYFWDAFFSSLQQPLHNPSGDISKSLLASSDDLIKFCVPDVTEEKRKAACLESVKNLFPDLPVGLPMLDATCEMRDNFNYARERIFISEHDTKLITSAIKKSGGSVNSAFLAAQALAIKSIQAEMNVDGKIYSPMSNVDLRRYCKNREPRSIVGCCFSAVPVSVDVTGKVFQDLNSELKDIFDSLLQNVDSPLLYLSDWAATLISGYTTGAPPPKTVPYVSSMGIIDDFVQRSYGDNWEVVDLWLSPTPVNTDIYWYIWTWKDQFIMSVNYNQKYYDAGVISSFMVKTLEVLKSGLGLMSEG